MIYPIGGWSSVKENRISHATEDFVPSDENELRGKYDALVRENADYGEILCRCEDVTKAEVVEAIRRGAVSVDGVKRRVGTGMGRCQGSRCARAVMDLLAEELGIPVTAVRKDGAGSEILEGGHGKD